ncbi:MAG TPA: hypothetical protein VMZ22_03860 [Acidimicrobiales bacterium]|nr:hypothetical protein [Acidimicrobiales bacterium]
MSLLLLVTTFGLGLRHGVDWDHLAAITDITGAEFNRRRTAMLAVLYALGHGAAVVALGAIAILAGEHLPTWIDPVMERVVGVTLLVLAFMLVRSLRRRDAAPMSRGMMLFQALKRLREALRRSKSVAIEHQHDHGHDDAMHGHGHPVAPKADEPTAGVVLAKHKHRHVHAVDVTRYTVGGAIAIGVLHGIGAETGTQAIVLVSASRVASTAGGIGVLLAFSAGIIATTSLLAVAAAFGWASVARTSRAFIALTATTAVVSGVLGILYILGGGGLPAILA